MWGWIIQVTIISLLLIFLLHYLYSFFKTTLTSPKLKDLVNKPQEKYNTIYKSLQSAGNGGSYNLGEDMKPSVNDNSTVSSTSGSSSSTSTSMKDELKRYLNDLNSNSSNNSNSNANSNSSSHNNTSIVNSHNEISSVYSPDNILKSLGGANGISTRVNNTPNYMQNTDKISSSTETLDFGTPSMSSSYASAYSPY